VTVSPTSYEALVIDYAAAMLAGSTTFRTLVGAANAAAARAYIVETENGSAKSKPYALVHSESFKSDWLAHGVYGRSGEVIAIIHTANTANDTAPEIHRRLRNIGGAIRDEMLALQGTAGCLSHVTIDVEGPIRRDETGADAGTAQILLTIKWSSP
jgi:hypothetical protein